MTRGHAVTAAAVGAAAFLLLVGHTSVAGQGDVLDSDKIIAAAESGRAVAARGYPDLGVPPLDPWQVGTFEAHLEKAMLNLNFEATGLSIANGRKFELENVKTVVRRRKTRVDFTVKIPSLDIRADHYKMRGSIALVFQLEGKGRLQMIMKNVRALVTVTLDTTGSAVAVDSLVIKRLNVSGVQSRLSGSSAVVNNVISQHGPTVINDLRDEVAGYLKSLLVPVINEYIVAGSGKAG